MSRRKSAVRILTAVLATASFAACGGSSDTADTIPEGATVINAVDGLAWEAESYTATAVDGKVLIASENKSNQPHNLHIIDADKVEQPGGLDTPTKGDVDSAEFRLAPGAYTVICKITGHGAMKAALTVN
jgi:plastocyanin